MNTRPITRPRLEAGRVTGEAGADLALVADALAHGMHGVLRHEWRATGSYVRLHPDARKRLDEEVRGAALADRYFRRQTVRAVAALERAGIPALVFKGEALACTHYPLPILRPRCDTDVLVRKADMTAAGDVIEALGYEPKTMVTRDMVHRQRTYDEPKGAVRHTIDLHWDASNRPLVDGGFAFDELRERAVPLGRLAPGVKAPAPPEALVLACAHRVMHHLNSDRLIWLSDIGRIAEGLTDAKWQEVRRMASAKRLCRVCAAGVELAARAFGGSARTEAAVAELRAAAGHREPSQAYLDVRRGPVRRLLRDARHAGSFPRAVRLFASHAFPDAEYMRRVYGADGRVSLAAAYAYRAARAFRQS